MSERDDEPPGPEGSAFGWIPRDDPGPFGAAGSDPLGDDPQGSVPPDETSEDGFEIPDVPVDAAAGSESTSFLGVPKMRSVPISRVTGLPLTYLDVDEREQQQIAAIQNELFQLLQLYPEAVDAETVRPPEIQRRIEEINALLEADQANVDPLPDPISAAGNEEPPVPVDPLFHGVVAGLAPMGFRTARYHVHGFFASQLSDRPAETPPTDELAVAAVFGLLLADNIRVPGRTFATDVAVRLGEYTGSKALFDRTLAVVASEGRTRDRRSVRAAQWVTVARSLIGDGVAADDPQLDAKIRIKLAGQISSAEGGVPSATSIDLPDLEAQADVEIVGDNVRAMQAIHYSAMVEQMNMFAVVENLVTNFQNGLLPLGRGRAGDLLYAYWKKSLNRLSEVERRNMYARCFGLPGGDASISNPNREFADLFLRFVSAVSQYVRQFTVDDLLRSNVPFRVNEEAVRKAGRDLAGNLSLHGYGIAHFAAVELQSQIVDMIAILGDPEIKSAYGARDAFQVIDQVSALELGGAKNGIRYRTMATSGAIVIRWLAEHASVVAAGYGTPLLNMAEIRRPTPRPAGQKPTTNPTDRDLVDAVEQWLAITGTPDSRVEEYSQPVEGPTTTSRPIAIPQVAKDLLDSVGVSAAYTGGNGGGNRLAAYGVR
jgi:hypothetical protein